MLTPNDGETVYRVYIHVEAENADGDYVEVDLDFGPSYEAWSQEQAVAVARWLNARAALLPIPRPKPANVMDAYEATRQAILDAEERSITGLSRLDS